MKIYGPFYTHTARVACCYHSQICHLFHAFMLTAIYEMNKELEISQNIALLLTTAFSTDHKLIQLMSYVV